MNDNNHTYSRSQIITRILMVSFSFISGMLGAFASHHIINYDEDQNINYSYRVAGFLVAGTSAFILSHKIAMNSVIKNRTSLSNDCDTIKETILDSIKHLTDKQQKEIENEITGIYQAQAGEKVVTVLYKRKQDLRRLNDKLTTHVTPIEDEHVKGLKNRNNSSLMMRT